MSLDPTTEAIAHFAGFFHLAEEESRLRKEYQNFKLEQKEDEEEYKVFQPVENKAPYKSKDYNPHSPNIPQSPLAPSMEYVDPLAIGLGSAAPQPLPPVQDTVDRLQSGGLGPAGFGPSVTILPYVPIPSSVITVTYQSIWLSDDDVLGDVEAAGFVDPAVFHQQLDQAIDFAEALQPWSSDGLTGQFLADPTTAVQFLEVINAVDAPQIEGVTASVLHDDDALGIHADGELVDEVPALDDQLPVFIRHKREKLAQDDEEGQLAGHAKDAAQHDFGNDEFSTVINGQHNVSLGANEAHNHTNIQTNWIDAGVIAVAGDVIKLNAVSQVNVLRDVDQFLNQSIATASAPSQAQNIASIKSSSPALAEDMDDEEAEEDIGLPSTWNTERLEGDVTVTNYAAQHTFVTDTDRVDLTFTANSTSIVSGENQTYNYTHAGEFGFGYDLILVGGTMLSLNLINQTNVLMDDDVFSGPGLADASVSGNDNLLRNEVDIMQEGIDTRIDMINEFKDALEDLKNGVKQLSHTVAQNALFEGLDQLRVLYVDGDLTQMNIVDQINYMGDQDQVHMAMDAMKSVLDDSPVAITAGSNLLTNTANILENGLDSDVMAGGDYYSDALLYQAELIDTEAAPTGVGMSALASEAVAFLADGFIQDAVSDAMESSGFSNDAHTGGTALDVMQSMTT